MQGKRVNDDIIMYNKNFTIPDGQIQLEKLFKLFTVIYNAARDFEVATQSKQPRPRIDFKVNQVTTFLLQLVVKPAEEYAEDYCVPVFIAAVYLSIVALN